MNYVISGKVIHGDGYGKKLGFPTVNLETHNEHIPQEGIYSGNAILDNKKYRAAIIIGPAQKVEGHLVGYIGDAYGKEVALELIKFLRPYQKFDTEEELIAQIKKDINQC